MKKFFSMMVAFAAMFTFAACETTPEEPTPAQGTKLATPQVEITNLEVDGFTAQWGAVENAKSYSVILTKANSTKTEQQNVTTNSVSFTNLGIGTYTVSVKAIANDGYKDSDYGKATAAVEGLSEADWFQLSVFVTNEYEDQGYYSYNSMFYTMKGENVVAVSCIVTTADAAANYTKDEILSKLQALDSDSVARINTADGLFSAVSGCPANTELVFYALAENANGATVFTSKSAKTTEVVIPDSMKAFIGTYEATVANYYKYDEDGSEVYVPSTDTFEFIVYFDEKNGLAVDGFSVLGADYPTLAVVEEGMLAIDSGISLGEAQGYTYVWLTMGDLYKVVSDESGETYVPVEGEQGKFYAEKWASHYLVKDEAGAYACNAAAYDMGDGTILSIVFNDVFAIQGNSLYFLIDAWPAYYRAGDFAVTKTSDEVKDLAPEQASVKSYEFMNVMPSTYSVVF